ncbi:MAG: SAF domain-containing protein [Sulfurimonas sp.]
MKKIGIIGTGFISVGLFNLILSQKRFLVSGVLTRSDISSREGVQKSYMTNSLEELIDASDIIVECSGRVLDAAENIDIIMKNNIPVVTMNTEFHVTVGSYFVDKGFITEGEGDQPGSIAALHEEATMMGFKPKVYGNIKGFLNNDPTLEDMEFWAKKSNLSLDMVTSFTDGTKVQMEQAFVANGLGATILKKGLSALEGPNMEEHGNTLAQEAEKMGTSISDYVISSTGPAGVFVTATHDEEQKQALAYYKLGNGPYYTLVKPFHLPHLELYKTIIRVADGGSVLLNNSSNPTISVAAIAKQDLKIGEVIPKAIGSFKCRGEAIKIRDYPNHIPIGLIEGATLLKDIKRDDIITFDDLKIDNNVAIEIWHKILKKALK